ncbi:MAG: lipase secretion chaperone [Undibacterium curvum]|uniref:lipase secretion chaperone n=1 Tax=Undibacterium curvum TaxID=2762294 RepID=UPI003BEA004B
MKTLTWTLGLAAIGIAAFFTFWNTKLTDQQDRAQLTAPDTHLSFVRSMEGTQTDGKLEEAQGELVVNAELRLMFDYYLAATGEKSLAEIRKEIEKVLDQRLRPHAAAQAKQLLARYLQYKTALFDSEKQLGQQVQSATMMATAMRARWQAMQNLRLQYFSAKESQAMFGFDDAYDLDAIARLEIANNRALTEAEKQARLRTLDENLPADLKEAKNAPLQVIRLEEQANAMRNQGASEDDVYRMRAAAISPDAANRLAQVDREEADWKSRIQRYLNERRSLLSLGLSEIQLSQSMQELRNRYFSTQEQLRLPVYEEQ